MLDQHMAAIGVGLTLLTIGILYVALKFAARREGSMKSDVMMEVYGDVPNSSSYLRAHGGDREAR